MIFGKYVNQYYRKYWYLFISLFLVVCIIDLAQLLIPIIIGNLVTVFTDPNLITITNGNYNKDIARVLTGFTHRFTIASNENLKFYETDFFLVIATVSLIGATMVIGRITWRMISAQTAANIERDLRKEMFSKVINREVSFYDKEKVGGLMSYFTNDIQTIKMCFQEGLVFLTDLVVLGSISILMMIQMSPWITLITAIPLMSFIFLGGAIGKKESKLYKISNDDFEKMSDFAEENLQGFSVIKAFDKENSKQRSFKKYTKDVQGSSISYLKFSSLIDFGENSLLAITFALLLLFCSFSIVTLGKFPIAGNVKQIGDISKFLGLYDSLVWPMIAGGMLIDYVSRGQGARRRIQNFMDQSNYDEVNKDDAITEFKGGIEIKDLSFKYPNTDEYVLKNISLKVEPGTLVGILGKTGSGKSTLVSLLTRIYQVEDNKIFFDGVDINQFSKKDLSKFTSIVLQESFLFTGTIKENIAFSIDNTSDINFDKVIESAKFADIDKDINDFKDKYETIVGEKGSTLSGGQKQRISIARSFYKDPKLLILDDSLSAVDADTEQNIIDNLHSRSNKITTIMISHRVSTIKKADLILVIDKGEIIDRGSHSHLLSNCPLYKEIYQLQQLEKGID